MEKILFSWEIEYTGPVFIRSCDVDPFLQCIVEMEKDGPLGAIRPA